MTIPDLYSLPDFLQIESLSCTSFLFRNVQIWSILLFWPVAIIIHWDLNSYSHFHKITQNFRQGFDLPSFDRREIIKGKWSEVNGQMKKNKIQILEAKLWIQESWSPLHSKTEPRLARFQIRATHFLRP